MTLSRIEFRPKVNDHERDVVCRAENTNIANSAIEATHKLVIHCEYFCMNHEVYRFCKNSLVKIRVSLTKFVNTVIQGFD